jgi:hypothetical protein
MRLSKDQRALLFWTVCIPLRSYLATRGDNAYLRLFAALIGVRWMLGYENGDEGMFGGPAWWADDRHLHGILWTGYSLTGDSRWLKADTAYGAINWLRYHKFPMAK